MAVAKSTLLKTPDEVTAEIESKYTSLPVTQTFEQNLASYVKSCWIKAKEYKQSFEEQLLANKRQAEGVYADDKLDAIRNIGGSEIYILLTATKNRAAKAWIEEVLFQPGAKPWGIEPTPVPELPDEIRAAILEEILSTYLEGLNQIAAGNPNVDPAQLHQSLIDKLPEVEEDMRGFLLEKAKETAEEMQIKIDDQLTEGNWYNALYEIIPNIILGTGILKGPIYKKRTIRKPTSNIKTGRITIATETRIIPYYESRPPFNIYPAPNSTGIDDGYLFDRITMTPRQLQDLIGVPGYNEDNIREVLREYDEGGLFNWLDTDIDSELEEINSDTVAGSVTLDSDSAGSNLRVYDSDKLECLELWGAIQGKLLREWGMSAKDCPDEDLFYDVVVWQIGDYVIKSMLNDNLEGSKPFSKTSFIDRSDCFWGQGLAESIADLQGACNACARAIVNNVGMGSGPMIERNIDRIPREEISDNMIVPWKVWDVTDEQMSTAPAIKFYTPPLVAERILAVFTYFSRLADEHSGVPAYAHGDMNVGGAGRTASGLSMLMTGATRGIRSVIKSIDKHIIENTVSKQYYYNIEQKENYGLVCDYSIVARGSDVLMSKQQQAIRRMEFANSLANPIDIKLTGEDGRRYLLREVAKSLDMDADKVFPEQGQNAPGQIEQMIQGLGGGQGGGQGGGMESPTTLDVAGNPAQGTDFRQFTGAGGSAKRY